MTKRKKKATDMTTDELARRVFPKKVVEEIKRIAQEGEKQAPKKGKKS
jgi:hypothetical protein